MTSIAIFDQKHSLSKDETIYRIALFAGILLSLAAFVKLIVFDAGIILGPEESLVQYVPDDAFYYLILAKHFVEKGIWTFDGGTSLTSGFHLVWAYLLAGLYAILHPDNGSFLRLAVAVSSAITSFVAMGWLVFAIKRRNIACLLVFALLVTASPFLRNSVSTVEWSLVITLSSLYVLLYPNKETSSVQPKRLIIALMVGLVGTLCRSDFSLLTIAFLAGSLITLIFYRSRSYCFLSLAGVIGAALGLVLICVHNYALTGEMLQSSARMKLLWAQFGGNSLWSGIYLTTSIIEPGLSVFIKVSTVMAIVTIGFLLVLIGIAIWPRLQLFQYRLLSLHSEDQSRECKALFFGLASFFATIGYIAIYSRSSDVQPWYNGNLVIPIAILCVSLLSLIGRRYTYLIGLIIIVPLVVLRISGIYTAPPPWPDQTDMRNAGIYLHDRYFSNVGAWNAGIVSYYQGGQVINLDGLVNNDIYQYAIKNDLSSYLKNKNIRYIVDCERMFDPNYPFRKRAGIDDAALISKLTPLQVFGSRPDGMRLILYELIDP